ncbi:hypothetical protein D3C86_1823790 [compost metagenome]
MEVLRHVGQLRNPFTTTVELRVVSGPVLDIHEQFTAQYDVLVTFAFADTLHDSVQIKRRLRRFFIHLVNRRLRRGCWLWSREDAELLKFIGKPIHGCS